MSIIEKIHHIIQHQKFINFNDFMRITQQGIQGYYQQKNPIGKTGDFVTSTNFGPLLPWALANQIVQQHQGASYDVMEIGAGTGQMAIDFLKAAQAFSHLPNHYFIQEMSPKLKAIQKKRLKTEIPQLAKRIFWIEKEPSNFSFSGSVIVNEVLDCLPFHLVQKQNGLWVEKIITCHQKTLTWSHQKINQSLINYIEKYITDDLPDHYQTEICIGYKNWLENLSQKLKTATLFFIDYGYESVEYFHPQRNQGTMTCFYQHQKHDNPLIHLGEQDITAHVQFSAFFDQAEQLGYQLLSYQTQAQFLLNNQAWAYLQSSYQQEKIHRSLKNNFYALTDPHQMGNVFKCMTLFYQQSKP